MSIELLNEQPIPAGNKDGEYIDSLKRLNVGSGNKTMKSDDNGFFLGADKFADAPFSVDYDGNSIQNSGTFSGNISIGSGNNIIKGNGTDGFYIGHADFASAPFKVTLAGAVTSSNLTVIGGTITGATIQTGTSGLRCYIDSTNGYQFYDGVTIKGKIIADTTEGVIYDTRGSSHFFRSNATEYAQINNDGLLLPSSHKISFSGGSVLTDQGSKLECDRVFECTNISPKGTSQDIGSGGDEWRNAYIDNTIFMSNNGKIEADNATVEYNPGNSGNDAQWESVGNKRMQCNQDGNVTADGTFTGGGADIAEMYESLDGKKIEPGTSVVLVGDKIRKADEGETPIGVISSKPTIIMNAVGSDADDHWSGKYLRDDFGSYIMEEAEWWELPAWKEEVEEKNKKIIGDKKKKQKKIVYHERQSGYSDEIEPPEGAIKKIVKRRKINTEWDSSQKYTPRKYRDEWCVVGLLGRIPIKKDQQKASNWVKLKDINDGIEEWLVR